MNNSPPRFPAPPALPEFEPPADLWSRIERRHGQRRRQRIVRRNLAAVSAALLLVVGGAWWQPASLPTMPDAVADQRREALQLERDWQALVRDDAASGYVQLRPVDLALQQAYDRQAERDELAQLWSERSRVLRELIRHRQGNAGPITI